MKRWMLLFPIFFLCTSCSYSQLMMDPNGQIIRCDSFSWGYVGGPMARQIQNDCIESHRRMGFVEIEQVGAIGINMNKETPPIITHIVKGSPAEIAGLALGDQILTVDGQKVIRGEMAQALFFSRPGMPIELTIMREGIERRFRTVRKSYVEVFGLPQSADPAQSLWCR